jgi:hypothetical protein
MAGKSKKHRVANPVSLGTEAKAPMLSLNGEEAEEKVAREVARREPPADEARAPLPGHSW